MSATSGTYPVSAEPLERLHALLVEAVRRRRGGDPFHAPVTVAEIYQELAPYRSVRSALGVDMNADYEHTLVRLLSGEGQLARIEPAAAREQLERELESPNPNVGLYRKFAGCDVWLLPSGSPTPEWVLEHLAEAASAAPPEAPAAPPEVSAPDDVVRSEVTLPEPTPAGAQGTRPTEQPRTMMNEQESAGADAGPTSVPGRRAEVGAVHCVFCDSLLPAFRTVRFCPFCGADQSQRPCGACGEPLQAEWAFCIACGEPVNAADA